MNTSAEVIVDADGVAIAYGRRRVVSHVSFQVQRGTVTALLGRNGAGKTSLLRCLLGVQRPTAGRLRVFGLDPWQGRVEVLRRTGVVAETPEAPDDLDARRLVSLCGSLHERWDADAVLARIARFEVPLRVPFRWLSRGQRGAVMLALACGHAPELLVFDDPTLGLDVVARSAMFTELIAELSDRGTTVLLTTHDLPLVERLATHVAILHGGAIVESGDLEGLKLARQVSLEQIFVEATTPGRERVA